MKNDKQKVLYIGKAKNLKVRTKSYFNGSKSLKTTFLVSKVVDIEIIITKTEYEALHLENTLIKKHAPRYNINLKDGKSYPVIRITNEKFPRVFRTRIIKRDGSTYFGPYSDVKSIDLYIDLIRKLIPLRRCVSLKRRKSPCLYGHIGRCPAPCMGKITQEEYGKTIRKVKSFLSGQTAGLRKEVDKKMRDASADLNYEKAAEYRDALAALEVLNSQKAVSGLQGESQDYVDKALSGRIVVFGVMQMRGGKIQGKELYINEYFGDVEDALPQFLNVYYSEMKRDPPARLVLSEDLSDMVKKYFESFPEKTIPKVILPKTKKDHAIQAMVRENAESELRRRVPLKGDLPALEDLKLVLGLPRVPRRIEGFDISQLGGRHTVASMVSFLDGHPNKRDYRHYKIHSTGGKVDDYQAIAEVVGRRYQRLFNENLPKPDFILVDGGKGQVSAAVKVMKALGMGDDIPLAGLSKRREEIWLAGRRDSIMLPEGDPGLRILQHVRDETHRFATDYNKRLQEKELALSTLEEVPGIRKKRSEQLIKAYGSLEGIYKQTPQEIAATAKVGLGVAETLQSFLGKTLKKH